MNTRALPGSLIAAVAVVCCGLAACTSSQTPAPPQSRVEMLTHGTSKTWRLVRHTRPGAPSDVDDCLLDNVFIFSSTGEFVNDDGDRLCSPGDSVRQLRGTWQFSRDSTRLVISGSAMKMTVRIAELSGSTLVLEELSEQNNAVVSVSTFEAR